MANIVYGEFMVDGTEKCREAFFESTHFAECHDAVDREIEGKTYLYVKGEFRWGIAPEDPADVDLRTLQKDTYDEKDYQKLGELTLLQKSEALKCVVEAWSYYDDGGIIYHEIYDNGKIIKQDEFGEDELEDFDSDFDPDFSKMFEITKL